MRSSSSRFAVPLAITVALVMGASLGAASTSSAESTNVKVCVNKKSKAVYYRTKCLNSEKILQIKNASTAGLSAYEVWKSVGNIGTENDFLASLQGRNGSNGQSVWQSLNNCRKAFNLTQTIGTNLALKNERDKFERETNCLVEKASEGGDRTSRRIDYGLPIISDVKFISLDFENTYDGRKLANYEIRVRNYDAMSGDQPTTLCSTLPGDIIHVSGDKYQLKAMLRLSDNGIWAYAPVYFKKNGVCSYRASLGYLSVNEDPARFISSGWYSRWLERRGWM